MFEVMTGEKEIRFSSRTRAGTDQFKQIQKLRHALAGLLEKLPENLKRGREAQLLGTVADRTVYNIVPIYRAKNMRAIPRIMCFCGSAWRSIGEPAQRTLGHSEVLERPTSREGVLTFDFHTERHD
jgi:NTE family protein